MAEVTSKKLKKLGYPPSKFYGRVIGRELSDSELNNMHEQFVHENKKKAPVALHDLTNPYDEKSRANVMAARDELEPLRTHKNVLNSWLMPDACPTGSMPVGSVIEADAIIPKAHSADLCCSVMSTETSLDVDRFDELFNTAVKSTHFGYGVMSRPVKHMMPQELVDKFAVNKYLHDLVDVGHNHLGTQGDGNHFLFIGYSASTNKLCIVTHHGSRGVGARLYRKGIAESGGKGFNAFRDDEYFAAMEIVREWTKLNHEVIHDDILKKCFAVSRKRHYSIHNYVKKVGESYFHLKGATDIDNVGVIPLNMAAPVLIVERGDNYCFAPHGAGRNESRSSFMRGVKDREGLIRSDLGDIKLHSYLGKVDITELPSAYRDAQNIIDTSVDKGLIKIVDRIMPLGTIMAGEE